MCIGDELRNCLHRKRRIYFHDVCHAYHSGHKRDVADQIEIQMVIERRVDCVRGKDHKQRVAVSRRAYDRFGGDIDRSTRPTDNCERLLVTLLRGLGPWKDSVYLVGGLTPRYLVPKVPAGKTPHAGTPARQSHGASEQSMARRRRRVRQAVQCSPRESHPIRRNMIKDCAIS